MSDDSTPEAIAAAMREKTQRIEAAHRADEEACVRAVNARVDEICRQIAKLKSEPTGGIHIAFSRRMMNPGRVAWVEVRLGKYPDWASHPMLIGEIKVQALDAGSLCDEHLSVRFPHENSDPLEPDFRTFLFHYEGMHGGAKGPIDGLRRNIGACIALKEQSKWAPPIWYRVVGAVVGAPLAVVTYLVTAVAGGLPGVLLGWIPAWIAYAIARRFWAPALALLAYFALR